MSPQVGIVRIVRDLRRIPAQCAKKRSRQSEAPIPAPNNKDNGKSIENENAPLPAARVVKPSHQSDKNQRLEEHEPGWLRQDYAQETALRRCDGFARDGGNAKEGDRLPHIGRGVGIARLITHVPVRLRSQLRTGKERAERRAAGTRPSCCNSFGGDQPKADVLYIIEHICTSASPSKIMSLLLAPAR